MLRRHSATTIIGGSFDLVESFFGRRGHEAEVIGVEGGAAFDDVLLDEAEAVEAAGFLGPGTAGESDAMGGGRRILRFFTERMSATDTGAGEDFHSEERDDCIGSIAALVTAERFCK
jgi:hypothetical protein